MDSKKLTNEQFNALPDLSKRMVIAADVIAQIKSEKYRAMTGAYIQLPKSSMTEETTTVGEALEKAEHCEVCALGSIFASTLRLGGDCTLHHDEWYDENKDMVTPQIIVSSNTRLDFIGKIAPIFGYEMDYIEAAFETNWDLGLQLHQGEDDFDFDKVERAVDFGTDYVDDGDRLIAIMMNIIENQGVFNP